MEKFSWDRGHPLVASDAVPYWMTRALQNDFPGVRVKSLYPLNLNEGTTNRARLAVEYAEKGSFADPPESFFLKLPSAQFLTRLFTNLVRLGPNEVAFYHTISPGISANIPRAYYAACTGRSQRFALLLEDLSLRGARFMDITQPISYQLATQAIRELAALHAAFWDSPRLKNDLAWLKSPERNPLAAFERCLCSLALTPGLRRFPDLVPHELRSAARRIVGSRKKLESIWARGPLTVIHGDAHAGNMYALPNAVGLLDWQVVQCGQGMRDVSYFMITSLEPTLRRARQADLIKLYLAILREKGIAAPEYEEAWRQYRLHALYAWQATLVTAAISTLQMEQIARTGLYRTSEAVMNLDSVELMDECDSRGI